MATYNVTWISPNGRSGTRRVERVNRVKAEGAWLLFLDNLDNVVFAASAHNTLYVREN